MMKKYYHATDPENLASICMNGLRKGFDGQVYLAEDPQEACRFLALRFLPRILVVCVELEESEVEESFDHSYAFFKCRAWMHAGDIHPDRICDLQIYE